ncbi:hypothetical protein DEJ45_31640 [Streptomyces venezuelae]|uniref:hypothetical protein n=1 Tax=Streptomyces venezuelae TaxID=54571 RepID=UPI00123D24E5|nr:hypothetical protein [Streptomyces venezuelae]QES16489.1 hypothetical protein DEJ45_31640 [Streptomyces venezuelae]
MSSRSPDEFRLGVRPYDRGSGGTERDGGCGGTGGGAGAGAGTGAGVGAGDPGAAHGSSARTGEPDDPHELLHRARRLSAHGHPKAGSAWERAAVALRRAGGSLTPGDHADALDATALDCRGAAGPAAGPLFFRAADLHEQAGQRGKALVSRARALVAGPEVGATACARLTELCGRATALHAIGQADAAETATVHLLRGRARADLLDTAPDPAAEADALRAELTRLISFAAPHRADPAVVGVLADTRALLGRITAPDDPAAALVHLRAALAEHRAGDLPWPATPHELLLAAVLRATGAHEEARALLRAALAAGAPDAPLRAADRALLCLALARTVEVDGGPGRTATGAREVEEEMLALLAEAVRHADGPVEDVHVGAVARLRLGVALAERGRYGEASELLARALDGFAAESDAAARVRVRAWLAQCALGLGEPAGAAREYALAAAEAGRWDERRHREELSHRTAYALALAGSPERAVREWRGLSEAAGAGGTVDPGAPTETETATSDTSATSATATATSATSAPATATATATAQPATEPESESESAAGGDSGVGGPWQGVYDLPEPFGPPGRYQMNVYGEVGGAWPWATTAPGTRVQGCV